MHPCIRQPHPGDMGWIVQRHGELYDQEYGWGMPFEGIVAGIVANFMAGHNPTRERCWIAEVDGERAGCVMCAAKDQKTAKLRILLVEPRFRGLGIGRILVEECIRFARDAGYSEMILWTNSVLTGARRIYERTGFELVESEPHVLFGEGMIGETWQVRLNSNLGV